MTDLFSFSWPIHIFIIFIIGICVLAQTLTLVFSFFRHGLNKTGIIESIFEVFILLNIVGFALLYRQIVDRYNNGLVVATAYENIICKVYPWFFIGIIMFFLARSIKKSILSINIIKTNISALSVIHAVDTLHTGVLFSENDGHILLSNYQMQNLMIAITGKIFRNSIQFYDTLLSDKYENRYKKAELDGQMIYILPDGSAWMFTKTNISYLMKNYIHISASDVSKLWTLTAKLQDQSQELKYKSDELKKTISNLYILSKEREIDNAKIRAHDILGQRLSLLLRIIQNDSNLDYDLLSSLSKGLLAELRAEDKDLGVYDEIKNIQEIFSAIGVDIKFQGQLPNNTDQAWLCVDIIRESSTNAVRHGFATKINIKAELIDSEYKLIINNNGHTSTSPIIPSNGIRVMTQKVSAQGGNLNIIHYPVFTLSVVLLGGEEYEKGTYRR